MRVCKECGRPLERERHPSAEICLRGCANKRQARKRISKRRYKPFVGFVGQN